MLGGALEAFSTQTCMLLWMRASGEFTVPQNNNYPLGITAIGIVLTLVTSVAIDATKVHGPYGLFACLVQLIACIILLNWNVVGTGAKMAAYCKTPTCAQQLPVLTMACRPCWNCVPDPACRFCLG